MNSSLFSNILPNSQSQDGLGAAKSPAKSSALQADERALLAKTDVKSAGNFLDQVRSEKPAAPKLTNKPELKVERGEVPSKPNRPSVDKSAPKEKPESRLATADDANDAFEYNPLKSEKNKTNEVSRGLTKQSAKTQETLAPTDAAAVAQVPTQLIDAANAAEPGKISKEEILGAIGHLIGSNPEVLAKNPVIAFVSGRLEQLDPKQIPGLVAGSKFLSSALEQEDSAAFLDAPLPIQNLLDMVGIGSEVASQAGILKIDLNQSFTPREFLKAIGVDPKRVVAELALLKENIQLDGLNGYMERAARLKSEGKASQANAGISAQDKSSILKPTQMPPRSVVNGSHAGLIPLKSGNQSPSELELNELQANPQMGSQNAVSPYAMANQTPSLNTNIATAPKGATQNISSASSASPRNIMQKEQVPLPTDSNVQNVVGNAKAAQGFDPFQAMGQKLDQLNPKDVTTSKSQNFRSSLSLEEQLMTNNLFSLDQSAAIKAPTLATPTAGLMGISNLVPVGGEGALNAQQSLTKVKGSEEELDFALNEGVNVNAINADASASAIGNLNPEQNSSASQNIKPINAAAFAEVAALKETLPKQDMGGSFGDGEFSRSDSSVGESATQSLGNLQQSGGSQAKFEIAQKADIAKIVEPRVMEKATMLVKEGGGSILMDLGNPDIGKLEIALNVVNNKIEIKILAGSEQLREMISQEMPKLRESLSAQNLQLNDVHVGVGSGSAWQQGFANGSPNQGQNFSEFAQRQSEHMNSSSPARQISAKTYMPAWQQKHNAVVPQNGRIQVWA